MCFYWREAKESSRKNELTLHEIELISRNFKNLAYLSMGGGEPTLREDLDVIAQHFYKNSNTRFISFSTNGLLPETTEGFVRSMLSRCPDLNLKVNVSMDHIGAGHDRIRGVSGCFERANETYSRLVRIKENNKNLYLSIGTVLSSRNKGSIIDILDYVRRVIKPDAHSVELARGNARNAATKDVDPSEYRKVIDYMKSPPGQKRALMQALLNLMMEMNFDILKTGRMPIPCVAGKRLLTMNEKGIVTPCEMLQQLYPDRNWVMGDMRAAGYDIKRIMSSQNTGKILDFIKGSGCCCTFECAVLWSIIFNPKTYIDIVKEYYGR